MSEHVFVFKIRHPSKLQHWSENILTDPTTPHLSLLDKLVFWIWGNVEKHKTWTESVRVPCTQRWEKYFVQHWLLLGSEIFNKDQNFPSCGSDWVDIKITKTHCNACKTTQKPLFFLPVRKVIKNNTITKNNSSFWMNFSHCCFTIKILEFTTEINN